MDADSVVVIGVVTVAVIVVVSSEGVIFAIFE